jgi:ribosomal protein S27E
MASVVLLLSSKCHISTDTERVSIMTWHSLSDPIIKIFIEKISVAKCNNRQYIFDHKRSLSIYKKIVFEFLVLILTFISCGTIFFYPAGSDFKCVIMLVQMLMHEKEPLSIFLHISIPPNQIFCVWYLYFI